MCDDLVDVAYQPAAVSGNARSERAAGKVPNPKAILDRSTIRQPIVPPTDLDDDSQSASAAGIDDEAYQGGLGDDAASARLVDAGARSLKELRRDANEGGGGVDGGGKYRLQTPDGRFLCDCEAKNAMW